LRTDRKENSFPVSEKPKNEKAKKSKNGSQAGIEPVQILIILMMTSSDPDKSERTLLIICALNSAVNADSFEYHIA
jgi:hypothetical protein